MKKILPFLLAGLLLACVYISKPLPAPSAEAEIPSTAGSAAETVPPPSLPSETEAPTVPEGILEFNTYDITFRSPGESWDVYCGTLPLDAVIFLSDNPAAATFENGIVTALGNGTTQVHAICGDATISCVIRNVFDVDALDRTPVLVPPETAGDSGGFYDDAVFIGDSVSYMLSKYVSATGGLGSAQFLVLGSYSTTHAVNGTMLMEIDDRLLPLEQAIAATGAKKAFFMLGTNDIGAYGISATMANWETLLRRVREQTPELEIYIQSMTPVWTGGEIGGLNNPKTDEYNEKLRQFADRNGCIYVDIASYLKDATGGLAEGYCSDEYVHLTESGARVWVQVLQHFAENRKRGSS